MGVFKSYLRRLLQDLKDVKEANDANDPQKVEALLKALIEDTQKGIEDNG